MINLAEWLERASIYKILRKEIFFHGFAAKFKGINDPAAVIALAKAEGYNLSMSDFSEELSDEELDNVAGGANVNEGANDRGPKDKNRLVVVAF